MTGLWGAMANLGHRLSDQAVGNILRRHDIPPAPTRKQTTSWKDFIRAHMAVLVATDFFRVEVLTVVRENDIGREELKNQRHPYRRESLGRARHVTHCYSVFLRPEEIFGRHRLLLSCPLVPRLDLSKTIRQLGNEELRPPVNMFMAVPKPDVVSDAVGLVDQLGRTLRNLVFSHSLDLSTPKL